MSVSCECCVLSGRGLCDELITRPEESYRLWWVVAFDLEISWMRRALAHWRDAASKTNKEEAFWYSYPRPFPVGHTIWYYRHTILLFLILRIICLKLTNHDNTNISSRRNISWFLTCQQHFKHNFRCIRDTSTNLISHNQLLPFFNVFSTVHHSKELFNLPTLTHNSLFIKNMYVTLLCSTCFEH